MFIKDSILSSDKITHGFFGKRGGVSSGIYESLNCGPGTEDEPANVAENRAIVCKAIGMAPESLMSLYQIHSDRCVVVDAAADDRPQADAMVTDKAGVTLGILTADCVPVLFSGEKHDGAPVIGAAHAGWGGALKGVLESTLAAMAGLGAEPESIRAAIGPCIRQASYEVSDDFKEPFLAHDLASEGFFVPAKRDGHLMFDLPGYVTRRLMLAGVPEISASDMNTYFNEMDYFSYRRATHRGEPDYGRQISVIAING